MTRVDVFFFITSLICFKQENINCLYSHGSDACLMLKVNAYWIYVLIWLTGILPLGSRKLLYLGGEKKEIGDPRLALVASEILDFKIAKATSEDDEKKNLNDNNSDDNTHES